MGMKKPKTPPKRWRTKEARELAKAVTKAGGTVSVTGPGAMRIDGPDGHTTVSQSPATGRAGGKMMTNIYKQIERKTGLKLSED